MAHVRHCARWCTFESSCDHTITDEEDCAVLVQVFCFVLSWPCHRPTLDHVSSGKHLHTLSPCDPHSSLLCSFDSCFWGVLHCTHMMYCPSGLWFIRVPVWEGDIKLMGSAGVLTVAASLLMSLRLLSLRCSVAGAILHSFGRSPCLVTSAESWQHPWWSSNPHHFATLCNL